MTKPLLFPLEIYNHPAIQSLNLCQAGLFRILVEKYWKSGIELPKSDYALIRLSNADRRTFAKYKKQVIEALNITMPDFIEARTARQRKRENLQIHIAKSRAKGRLKKMDRNTTFSEPKDTHVQVNPIPFSPEKSRYHQGQYDHVARNKAIEANKSGKEGWLSDD